MSRFTVSSLCECQAALRAVLDDKRFVLSGSSTRGGRTDVAPAHSIGPASDRFDVAWMCPHCGRNVLRSFAQGALRAV